jgi:hypothetical protein
MPRSSVVNSSREEQQKKGTRTEQDEQHKQTTKAKSSCSKNGTDLGERSFNSQRSNPRSFALSASSASPRSGLDPRTEAIHPSEPTPKKPHNHQKDVSTVVINA